MFLLRPQSVSDKKGFGDVTLKVRDAAISGDP